MRILTVLLLLFSLSACGLFYHVPVRQGNVLTPDDVARLEAGMTKQQVRYVMGTPLVRSAFENNRWDYVFYYRDPNGQVRKSVISLYFVNGRVSEIMGDDQFLQASRVSQPGPAEQRAQGQAVNARPGRAAGGAVSDRPATAGTVPDVRRAA